MKTHGRAFLLGYIPVIFVIAAAAGLLILRATDSLGGSASVAPPLPVAKIDAGAE